MPGRRLIAAEMDEKRVKGFCFFRVEKYGMGHKFKSRKQLFMVDVVDEEMTTVVQVEDDVLI